VDAAPNSLYLPIILATRFTGTENEIYINGVLKGSTVTSQTITGITKLSVGKDLRTDREYYLNADVQHIRAYPRALTDEEMSIVTSVLFDKWDIRKKARTFYASAVFNPSNMASGTVQINSEIYVPGVDYGDLVEVSCANDLQSLIATAYVRSPGRISILLLNLTGNDVNLSNNTWILKITKPPIALL
jgi:hypothetical protein